MNISLVREGLLRPEKLEAWTTEAQDEIRQRVVTGMRETGPEIVAAARAQAATALKGNKASRSIYSKVWSKRPDRLPALQIASKIPFLGVHEYGAVITGKMLIQLGSTNMKRSQFQRFLMRAKQEKRSFLRKGPSGKTLLFVKGAGKGDRLGRFKTAERGRRRAAGESTRIRRTDAVPVAILVNRITIKKRLRMTETVQRMLPRLARAIEEA